MRTTISTGPRGATRFAQGLEAVVTVGSEYLSQQIQVKISALESCFGATFLFRSIAFNLFSNAMALLLRRSVGRQNR